MKDDMEKDGGGIDGMLNRLQSNRSPVEVAYDMINKAAANENREVEFAAYLQKNVSHETLQRAVDIVMVAATIMPEESRPEPGEHGITFPMSAEELGGLRQGVRQLQQFFVKAEPVPCMTVLCFKSEDVVGQRVQEIESIQLYFDYPSLENRYEMQEWLTACFKNTTGSSSWDGIERTCEELCKKQFIQILYLGIEDKIEHGMVVDSRLRALQFDNQMIFKNMDFANIEKMICGLLYCASKQLDAPTRDTPPILTGYRDDKHFVLATPAALEKTREMLGLSREGHGRGV